MLIYCKCDLKMKANNVLFWLAHFYEYMYIPVPIICMSNTLLGLAYHIMLLKPSMLQYYYVYIQMIGNKGIFN